MISLKALCFYVVCLTILFTSCRGDGTEQGQETSEAELKEALIESNKAFVENENDRINSYIVRHKYNMIESGTGLRYQLLDKSTGQKANDGDRVQIAYTLKLLNGETIVDENESDTMNFTIGKSEIPSGINEGVQFMQKGQRARFILPAHLAFGLSGNNNKVPPNAALLYQIKLLEINSIKKTK